MKIIKPPNHIPHVPASRTLFLAGSIEQGSARDWQQEVADLITERYWAGLSSRNPEQSEAWQHAAVAARMKNVVLLNPRRDNWDSSLEQNADNEIFHGQVEWELDGLEQADVLFYFQEGTRSPISLLELGLMAGTKPEKTHVVCDDLFWRKGNVDVVCDRYDIQQYRDLKHFVSIYFDR